MQKINVVLATDANYLPYLEVTLKSLLAHNQNLSVFVMNTGDIPATWVNQLQPFFAKRNASLKVVHLDKSFLETFDANNYISTATYLRFFMPALFQYSDNPYWIYLDCDTVINGDITLPFKEYDFSHYALGAVSDPYVNGIEHAYKNRDYFNAGVLYFNHHNFAAENKSHFTQDLLTLAQELKESICFGDQDLLNYYFKNDWLSLSKKYNFQLDHMLYQADAIKQPAILHFTGPNKPLAPINSNSPYVSSVMALFRLYHSLSWNEIVNLPLGTITLSLKA